MFFVQSILLLIFLLTDTRSFLHTLSGACGAGGDCGEAPGGVQHGRAAGEGGGEDSLPGGGAAGV